MQSFTPRSSGEHIFFNMKKMGGVLAYGLELQVPADGTFLLKTQGKKTWKPKQTAGRERVRTFKGSSQTTSHSHRVGSNTVTV